MSQVIELEIPSRPDFLALARLVAAAVAATDSALDDDRIADLRLAVSEACTNAMEAHWRPLGRDLKLGSAGLDLHTVPPIQLRCWGKDGEVDIEVTDRGPGFEPNELLTPPAATDPDRLDFERGLGIPLIKTLADEVEFRSTPTGTTVRMVLRA